MANISASRVGLCLVGLAAAAMACVCTPVSARTSASLQAAFSDGVPGSTVPFVRRRSFLVNVRIRPLLFWIGRDAIGDAHLTWRAGTGGHRAFAFLIGSDPARTPRKINRWGFIVEELNDAGGEILAVMKDSGEKTIEEAEAGIARETETSTFKAVRTTIDGSRVSSGSITFHAPAHLTYRELEGLLALMPNEPSQVRTVELPPGTEKGFLAAMDSLIRASLGPCGTASGSSKGVPLIPISTTTRSTTCRSSPANSDPGSERRQTRSPMSWTAGSR